MTNTNNNPAANVTAARDYEPPRETSEQRAAAVRYYLKANTAAKRCERNAAALIELLQDAQDSKKALVYNTLFIAYNDIPATIADIELRATIARYHATAARDAWRVVHHAQDIATAANVLQCAEHFYNLALFVTEQLEFDYYAAC